MIYTDYLRLMDRINYGTSDEMVSAKKELAQLKTQNPYDIWCYEKWYNRENGIESAPEVKPVNAAKKPVKASPKNDKPKVMSYDQFKDTFNRMCDDARLMNTTEESPVRVLSKLRNEHPDVYDSYKERMEKEAQ